ncbi:MAG TPA: HD domain-containing phosphohydrolase [Symbiobacteriaceae bacterium]|nr:HD domain-containing phosphohydrolase [Symbiobacteriaceae bacterium]
MEGILRSILAAGYPQLHGRGLMLFRYDPLSESFPDEWRLMDGEIVRRYSTQVTTTGMTARLLRTGEPVLVNDAASARRLSPNMPPEMRMLGLPVEVDGVPWGALYVSSMEGVPFSEADIDFFKALARQLGASVNEQRPLGCSNVELSTVRVLAATVDAKDHYTRHHSTNVSFYARLIAREMNLDPAEVRRIDLAGLLHDIGKIAIPDQILQKPGPLTPEERLLVNTHAAIGANILAQAAHMQHLVPLVRHHHERYDGKGYPDGLKGDEIPLGAMILNLADSFDTMTTRRVYRAPLSLDAAMAEVQRCSGAQFHPEVVRAMQSMVERAVTNKEPWVVSLGSVQEMSAGFADDGLWQGDLGGGFSERLQHRDTLDFLVEARLLQHITDGAQILQRAGEQLMDFWSADVVQIYLMNHDECTLQLAWSDSSDAGEVFARNCQADVSVPLSHGLAGWAALTNQGITVPDARRDPRWPYAGQFTGPVSVLVAPIGANGSAQGVVQLVSRGEGRFGWPDVKVMKVFNTLLGTAVQHARSTSEERELLGIDSMTGVRNANYLRLLLEQLEKERWEVPLSVAFLDGDDLKGINDRYGHGAGDQVICHVARSLQAWRRPEDVVIRFGGDEFLVLFGGLSLPEASARLEHIRMTISEIPVELPGGRRVYVSVSCGVTEIDATVGPYQAVRAAEQAMYQAKRSGKNRIWTAAG